MQQFRVLYRQFLFRLVDLDLISSRGDLTKLFGQFAALLVFASVLFTFPALGVGGSSLPPLSRMMLELGLEHFLIATTMLAVGLFTVLCWDSAFPDRRDVMVLGPLPVRARTLFLAKIAAVATGLALTIALLHMLAGIAWPLALGGAREEQQIPALTFEPSLPPLDAQTIASPLSRDIQPALGEGVGIVIGVAKRGVHSVCAFGSAKRDSIFQIGSITKPLTGLILARMVANGDVRLDEPLRMLLPPGTVSRPAGPEITLLDLATHRSGLPRIPDNLRPENKDNPAVNYSTRDLLAYVSKKGVAREGRQQFEYSNTGFAVLGQALAIRAGRDYSELLESLVTGPLGMRDTTVALTPEQRARLIQGHSPFGREYPPWDLNAIIPAGGVYSTADDMLPWLEANLHPASAPAALGPAIASSQRHRARIVPGTDIALAWVQSDTTGGAFTHNGAVGGYSAHAFFHPKQDIAAIVLLNKGPGPVPLVDLIGTHVRQRLTGEPAISLRTLPVPARTALMGTLRAFAAYWITMVAAGVFLFCSVLAAQGLCAQVLPRRWFLRVSSAMQLGAFCLFVSVYFLQPMVAHPRALVAAQGDDWLAWSPSYWFLGLFQQINGSPALAPLARRAWIGLGAATSLTAITWALSYWRTVRRIVEEPDIVPAVRSFGWMPKLGSAFESAVGAFALRALMRSRWHRLLLAFYLGVALASVIFMVRSPSGHIGMVDESDSWHPMSVAWIAASLLGLGFWTVGMRVVFSIPLDPRANWIFQVAPVKGGEPSLRARRRALWLLSVAPACATTLVCLSQVWPWRAALEHFVVLVLVGAILAEFCLRGAQKLPFACTYSPGRTNLHLTFWACLLLVLSLIVEVANLERKLLERAEWFAALAAGLAAIAFAAYRWNGSRARETRGIEFEDPGDPAVLELALDQ
ncbi:MAG: serine hydrolase [Bryobacteraceae bacterium]